MDDQLRKLLNETGYLLDRVKLLIEKVDKLTERLNTIIYENDEDVFSDW